MKSNAQAKRTDVYLSWLPLAHEWDFRSVTPQECRVAACWECEREYLPMRLLQSGAAKSAAMPPALRQAACELFPQPWVSLAKDQWALIVGAFPPAPALQVWTALLVYVLLRYQAFRSRWGSSYVRLWTCVRAALWLKLDAVALLKSYGPAGGGFRLLGQPEAAYGPGFRPEPAG